MFCPRCHRDFPGDTRFCPHDGEATVAGPRIDYIRSGKTRDKGLIVGGRYEVRGFIGKGAMAKVYLAEDLHTHEPVAIKVLDKVQARGESARTRFFREARAAAMLTHENIVRIQDVGVRDDGIPYLVLEFLFGESLGELLRRAGTLPPPLALAILAQAAAGLASAHAVGIVHRDVKPDNVFLVGEPGDPYGVKLLDFGLAKLDSHSGFTQAGTAVGTMEYMAPEQVLTERTDARTDVYGLGVVMYRMFTGQLPFRAKEEAELLARQLVTPAEPPSIHDPAIGAEVEAVILGALRKRPENRYPSMEALAEDLERLTGTRDGAVARRPLAVEPDAYEPRSAFARHAATFFYKKLGVAHPAWTPLSDH